MPSARVHRVVEHVHAYQSTPCGAARLDACAFAARYVATRKPVVLRGLAASWPAAARGWAQDVQRSEDDAGVGALPCTLSRSRPDGVFGRVGRSHVEFAAQQRMSFREAWKVLFPTNADTSAAPQSQDLAPSGYLYAGSGGAEQGESELVADLLRSLMPDERARASVQRGDYRQPWFAEHTEPRAGDAKALLWLSGGGTTACTHRDSLWNLHAVLWGAKRFLLAPPELYRALDDRRRFGLRLRLNAEGTAIEEEGLHASAPIEDPPGFPKRFSGFSPFSLSEPDAASGAAASCVLEANLEEGDVLFLPPGYWHEVSSSPDASGRSLALNFWQEVLFDHVAGDDDVERDRLRYLDAVEHLEREEAPVFPAWMDAF